MNDIFLAYGVRGIADKTLTAEAVKKIAWAFGKKQPGSVLLARDCRNSSERFYGAAYSGLAAAGAEVLPVGLATTPMAIFGINHHRAGGGLVITASHNPPEWNGMKFYAEFSRPIGLESGLAEIRDLGARAPAIPDRAVAEEIPLLEEYENFLTAAFEASLEKLSRPFSLVVDNGNGAVSVILERLLGHFPWISSTELFWEPDGTFPGRGPNPLLEGALESLRRKVLEVKADFGIAFDADGDRVFFVDEGGNVALSDWVLAWLADEFLSRNPGEKIVVPVGAPRIVEDLIRRHGGEPIFSKAGFVFMRRDLQAANAIFGGERSGHYYFRDFFFADAGIWTMFTALQFFLERRAQFSEILAPYRKYATTGEMNFEVHDRAATIEMFKKTYASRALYWSDLDGFFADMGDWWMSARPSNTEPLVRIVIESASGEILERARKEVLALVGEIDALLGVSSTVR